MSYQPTPTQTTGGQKRVWTTEDEVRQLLRSVVTELRKLNLQLATITDQEIGDEDLTDPNIED